MRDVDDAARRWGLAILLGLLVVWVYPSCRKEASEAKSAPVRSESWFEVRFHGDKVGYLRAWDEETRLADRPAVHANRWSVFSVRRGEERIRMEHTLDAWFGKDGTPLRYKSVRTEAGEVRKGEGYRDGNRFIVRQTVGGRVRTRTFDLKSGDRLASSIEWLHLRELKPGLSVKGRAIDESQGDIEPFTLKVGQPIKGRQPKVYAAEETLGKLRTSLEVGEAGVLRSELVGTGFVVSRTTREVAMRLEDPVDIFSAAMFPLEGDVELPSRELLKGLTLRFSSERGLVPPIPSYANQTVERLADGRVLVKTSAAPVPQSGGRLPLSGEKLARFLSSTDYEDIEDPRLVAASRREVGDAKDAWTAARRINRFVYRHLETKNLAHAFSSATEAMSERAGDCTEHAVLFSALAKIAGIPTKLVTGLIYVGGDKAYFGYHAWVEVYLGTGWHPMDPTFGQDVADPTHIKFFEGISDARGLREAGLAAGGLIGDTKIVLEAANTWSSPVKP